MNRFDQFSGCIIGGAIGDAFGGQFENVEFEIESEELFIWGGIKEDRKFFLSDDTQLTLATCESIIESGKVDPEAISQKFVEWYEKGKLSGLGSATLQAIQGIRNGGHWWIVGKKGERAAGNGSAMRIAPIAFALNRIDRTLIQSISRITHHNDEAYAGSLAIVLAIQDLISNNPQPGDEWLMKIGNELPDTLVRDRIIEYAGLVNKKSIQAIAKQFGNSGYVVESVPFALFGVVKSWEIGFEAAINEIVQSGGDADTNASMMGQIAGAELGIEKLPISMLKQIELLPEYLEIKSIIAQWNKRKWA